MNQRRNKNRLAAVAIVTGIAALAGVIEPALATQVMTSLPFTFGPSGLTQMVTIPTGDTGTFSGSATVGISFSQFNASLGTLNSVEVFIAATNPMLTASVAGGECDEDVACSASATNTSTFSVGVDAPVGGAVEFALAPTTQMGSSPTATASCDGSVECDTLADTESSSPALGSFDFVISTPSDLTAFIGSGMFNVIPDIALSGAYMADNDNGTDVTATTNWDGTIKVIYNYTAATTGVPEPASLVLIGAALAALGFSQRKRNRG